MENSNVTRKVILLEICVFFNTLCTGDWCLPQKSWLNLTITRTRVFMIDPLVLAMALQFQDWKINESVLPDIWCINQHIMLKGGNETLFTVYSVWEMWHFVTIQGCIMTCNSGINVGWSWCDGESLKSHS